MTLGNGSRGQLHIYVLIQFVSKYHQAILHNIGAARAYTLRAKHVTFGVHGSILIT